MPTCVFIMWTRLVRMTYLCLNHVDTLGAHALHEAINIDLLLSFRHVQQIVKRDECAGPADTSAATEYTGVSRKVFTLLLMAVGLLEWGGGGGAFSRVIPAVNHCGPGRRVVIAAHFLAEGNQ